MADETQKPFLDKVSDGLYGVGEKISTGFENFVDKSAAGQDQLASLSDADRALVASGDTRPLLQAQNFQDIQSTLSAQNPAPLVPSGDLDAQDNISNAVPQLLQNTAVLSQNKGRPLSEGSAKLAAQGTPIVSQDLQGTSASVSTTTPTTEQQSASTQASQISGIQDPFAVSNATKIAGISNAEEAGVKAAAAEHTYFTQKAKFEEDAANDLKLAQEKFEFNYQEKMDDYEQSVREYKQLAGEKIIPNAFLARQDTAGSLMTGLAVALGGIGGALQGTNKNIGLEMIEKAIDRDVAAQQYNLEHKTKIGAKSIDIQDSLLAKMRAKFQDDKSAILATKAAMTEMVQSKMNQKLTEKGGARDLNSKAQAQLAMGQILEKKEMYLAQLKAAEAERAAKLESMRGVDYYDMTNEQALQHFGEKANMYVRGYGMSTDPQLAKDFIQKVKPMGDTVRKLKNTMAQIDNLSKFNPKDRAAMQSIMRDLQLTLKDEQNYKLGVLTGPDMSLLEEITGDPNSFNPMMNSKERLKQALKNISDKMDNQISNYGFDPSRKPKSVDMFVKPLSNK